MPYLEDLNINVGETNEFALLVRFFASSFRPVKKLTFSFPLDVQLVLDMLDALAKNTRVSDLYLVSSFFPSATALLDCGCLTRVWQFHPSELPESVSSVLKRNAARHSSCRRTCVALLIPQIRKHQRIPREIMQIIARYLWDSRNKSDWDIWATANCCWNRGSISWLFCFFVFFFFFFFVLTVSAHQGELWENNRNTPSRAVNAVRITWPIYMRVFEKIQKSRSFLVSLRVVQGDSEISITT
mgnify:CR=1 FL=1